MKTSTQVLLSLMAIGASAYPEGTPTAEYSPVARVPQVVSSALESQANVLVNPMTLAHTSAPDQRISTLDPEAPMFSAHLRMPV
ncbi:hypothetical protein TWF106_008562 [Orbilia oligospora]|uniref:Uncharacterized protein n=1 Tax=Orbilia oligospora TaxID=2813651 RepID=A0A7C8USG1_ORBOL|nr:hypothetical protein TWF106_008562 [Orbilia oligospora]